MTINKSTFRAYDIRGNSLFDISPTIAYKIGFCFAQMNIKSQAYKKLIIVVGRDGRLSSPALYDGLVQGLIDGNAHVLSIGIVPTPVLYFADKKFQPAASIMITGSHNQKNDNGFKMLSEGKSFCGEKIQDLLNEILKINWENKNIINFSPMNIEEVNINDEYINRILDGFYIEDKLKVAWDPGNGASGNIIKTLTTRLLNNNIIINSIIDGNFPNHHPDPTILENMQQLLAIVASQNCDIGIGFDGDADRIGIVTKKGCIILGDQILCLFAKDIIKTHPNTTIIMDVSVNQCIFDQIELYGGRPLMWKTGNVFIKNKMLETGALLAGEMSGHIFFADKYYGYDDAIYAAIRFLDLLSRSNKSLDEMIDELPQSYSIPAIKIVTKDNIKFKLIEQIKQQLINNGIDFIDIDGLRVNTKNGWWLLRASNTEAILTARCGSSTFQGLEILKSDLSVLIAQYGFKLGHVIS